MLAAFGFAKPSRLVVAMARGGLRVRGRLERLRPPRRKPRYARDLKRVKSYPGGFLVERLGTFPATMPEMDESVV